MAEPHKATSPAKKSNRRQRRSLTRTGWIPDYHGAWAMVFVPIILGIALSNFRLAQISLFLLWVVGYFFYFALTKWFLARKKETYSQPVKVYLLVTVILGLTTIWAAPTLLYWAPWFAILISVTVALTYYRKERTMVARGVTIAAGVLVGAAAYDLGTYFTRSSFRWLPVPVDYTMAHTLPGSNWYGTVTGWNWIWLVSLVLFLYFFGTVPVVKTVIRARRSVPHLVFSIVYHVLLVALALTSAIVHWTGWVLFAVSLLLLARAAYFPLSMRLQGKRWSAKVIGITEIVATALVVIALFLP